MLERSGRRALAITSTRRIRFRAAGRRRVTFKLTRRGRRLLKHRRRGVVRIRASAWLDSGERIPPLTVRHRLRLSRRSVPLKID
jgi:DNA-binding PadR family transcriptional regulator